MVPSAAPENIRLISVLELFITRSGFLSPSWKYTSCCLGHCKVRFVVVDDFSSNFQKNHLSVLLFASLYLSRWLRIRIGFVRQIESNLSTYSSICLFVRVRLNFRSVDFRCRRFLGREARFVSVLFCLFCCWLACLRFMKHSRNSLYISFTFDPVCRVPGLIWWHHSKEGVFLHPPDYLSLLKWSSIG